MESWIGDALVSSDFRRCIARTWPAPAAPTWHAQSLGQAIGYTVLFTAIGVALADAVTTPAGPNWGAG
mgnify:CR=1 FL=1